MDADVGAVLLLYHRVHDADLDPWRLCVSPHLFAEHLGVLREQFSPIALHDLVEEHGRRTIPPRSVVVTFDDGYADLLHEAAPLLRQFGVPATAFLVSDMIGRNTGFWWDELESIFLRPGRLPRRLEIALGGSRHRWDLGDEDDYTEETFARRRGWRGWGEPDPGLRQTTFRSVWQVLRSMSGKERDEALTRIRKWARGERGDDGGHASANDRTILTETEVSELVASGIVQIGAHTKTHSSLAPLSRADQRDEIEGSKRRLEMLSGLPVSAFSYPFGQVDDYTADTVELVRSAGFRCACVNSEGAVDSTTDLLQLPRLNVLGGDGRALAERLTAMVRRR